MSHIHWLCTALLIVAGTLCLVSIHAKLGAFGASIRKLSDEQMMSPLDNKRICSGPRRGIVGNVLPFYKHERTVYGLHVGHSPEYGQTNNQIITLFNAVDTAMSSSNITVVVVSGWAQELLMKFFPDDESWEILSRHIPIVRNSSGSDLIPVLHTAAELFERKVETLREKNTWEVTQSRRLAFLHYIFSSLGGEPCRYLSKIEGYLFGKYGSTRYIAIHVRNMDGNCIMFNSEIAEQCSMDGDFIKSIVEPTHMYGRLPIVLLSDMQNDEKLRRIQREVEKVVIPQWDLDMYPSVLTDLVIGGASDLFIGVKGSSMSRNIGLVRQSFGREFASNFVFIKKAEDGGWTSLPARHPYTWKFGEN